MQKLFLSEACVCLYQWFKATSTFIQMIYFQNFDRENRLLFSNCSFATSFLYLAEMILINLKSFTYRKKADKIFWTNVSILCQNYVNVIFSIEKKTDLSKMEKRIQSLSPYVPKQTFSALLKMDPGFDKWLN